MRNLAEISATAGLLVCTLAYAGHLPQYAAVPSAAAVDWSAQDAVLARRIVQLGDWVGQPLARCYATQLSADGWKDGSEPARALACDGEALAPIAG